MDILGIDIGGSGMKAAVIDTETGDFRTERHRIETPSPANVEAVLGVLSELIDEFQWSGPVGCGFPGVIHENVIYTAANLDPSLINLDLGKAIREKTGCPAFVLNDADAAGYAEMRLGAGKDEKGVVFVLTIGTGIGTALFSGGNLVPNTELGHIIYNGEDAETVVSEAARKREDLTWKKWGRRFDGYLRYLEELFWPDLFILGGGGAKKPEKFAEYLTGRTPFTAAKFRNRAGIIGAALYAKDRLGAA